MFLIYGSRQVPYPAFSHTDNMDCVAMAKSLSSIVSQQDACEISIAALLDQKTSSESEARVSSEQSIQGCRAG